MEELVNFEAQLSYLAGHELHFLVFVAFSLDNVKPT